MGNWTSGTSEYCYSSSVQASHMKTSSPFSSYRYLSATDRLEDDDWFRVGYSRVALETNKHFSGIPVNTNLSSVHVPTNVFDGGEKWKVRIAVTRKEIEKNEPPLIFIPYLLRSLSCGRRIESCFSLFVTEQGWTRQPAYVNIKLALLCECAKYILKYPFPQIRKW